MRTPTKPLAVMVAAILVLAACGGDDTSEEGSSPTLSSDVDGATAADTAAAAAEPDGSCVVGMWEAPREAVEEQVDAALAGIPGVEPELEEGSVTADFRNDGTADFVTQAVASGTDPALGRLTGSIDATMGVTWMVEGERLSYTTTSWDMELLIADQPFPGVPGPTIGETASVTFTCTGDVMTIDSAEGALPLPTRWNRVG